MKKLKSKETNHALVDERSQVILRQIIDSYIHTSEPVGSRTLSKSLEIQLSPATIRNIMADLSEQGYLTQAHTSGGRIPTDKAYRFYVDTLAVADELPAHIQEQITQASQEGSSGIEQLLENTTKTLAGLTEFVCVLTAPKADYTCLQRIEFMKVAAHKILVILITKSGVIRNKIIESAEDLSQSFLNSVSQFLNEQFHNASLLEIRNRVLESMMQDKDRYDDLLAQALRLGKKAFENEDDPTLYVEGQMNLLLSDYFQNQELARNFIDAFDHKSQLIEVLDNTLQAKGIQIFIGLENPYEELQGFSMVTANYGIDSNILGTIGVIGPTSMDYQRIIPTVDYTAQIISNALIQNQS